MVAHRFSDFQVKDYLSFHEPGPLHTYDRIHAPGEHKYEHLWHYKYSNRPGSQIIRKDVEKKPVRRVKRLDTPKQAKSKPSAQTKQVRNSPKARAAPNNNNNNNTRQRTPKAGASPTTTRRPAHKPLEMWQYKDYLSYHEPGPYHDYNNVHKPGHHPYEHMWYYNMSNRPGSQHVRVEPHKEAPKRRVIVKPKPATPKPKPRQQPVKKAEEQKTMKAEERKVATPPPPPPKQVRRAEPVPPPPPVVVTQQRKQQAPPPVRKVTPPPRHTTPPPPRQVTPPPPRQVIPPPPRQVTPPRRRYSPPPTLVQQYRSEPRPLVREPVVAAATPKYEAPVYHSRIPVRRSHQTPPPRLSPPPEREPLFRRDYRVRPESKWNAPRIDRPTFAQKQRELRAARRDQLQPRWKPIKTYNGTPRQGPLSTNYGDHSYLYDYSRPSEYSGASYPRYSYHQNDHYYVPTTLPNYRYEPSYYTGNKDPLSSIKRTMVLYGV